MHTHTDDRLLDDRTDEKQRAPQEVYRLARLSAEMVTPWQLPQIGPGSDPSGLTHAGSRTTVIQTEYVVAWQLKPAGTAGLPARTSGYERPSSTGTQEPMLEASTLD